MVGVFMVMWLAALMTLAASGMQHRQLASRFIAYTNDRAGAFAAADRALVEARDRITHDEYAADIAAMSAFEAGPLGVLEANHRGDIWYQRRVPRWRTVEWHGSSAVIAAHRARYFIERIAFSAYATAEPASHEASVRRYRVSAMGCGELPGARVYLQAIYEVRRQTTAAKDGVASPSFSSRQLSWREVATWHEASQDGAVSTLAPNARQESCDAP
jgi:Tfp pilus assembly protein PilX